MSELKPCPFCGSEGAILDEPFYEDEYGCFCNKKCGAVGPCDEDGEKAIEFWNTRPIEDALRAEIARLSELLHDEMSQLEIATELGNKRWIALNEIYENGEKHNANWCKRKAQEGLGIK